MGTVLFKILEMSISGGIAILAVLLLRLVFRRFPKKLLILFWIIVALRLVIPINLSSPTSALNIRQIFTRNETNEVLVEDESEEDSVSSKKKVSKVPEKAEEDHSLKRIINSDVTVKMGTKATPTVAVKAVLASVWLSIAIGLFVFFMIRYFNFYSKARWCSRSYDGRYFMTEIESPFVIGFLSPKIFVPVRMNEDEREYILNHEWTHIKNKDGLTKLICYFILCIHWFNPLVWLAYVMLCADMEMRVDEETTSSFDMELVKEYCMSIVLHATSAYKSTSFMQGTAFSGLGFGGMEAKLRVANLLKSKKINKALQIVVLIFAFAFTFLVSTLSYDFDAKADTKKTTTKKTKITETEEEPSSEVTEKTAVIDDKMFEAYAKTAEDFVNTYGTQDGELRFELVYIDEDEVPELIISRPGYYVNAYSYYNGNVEHFFEGSYGAYGNLGFNYLPHKNTITNRFNDNNGNLIFINIMNMDADHKTIENTYNDMLNMRYYDSEPDEYYPIGDYTILSEPRYYIGTTELTEEEFYTYLPDGDYKHLGKGTDYDSFIAFMANKEMPTYPSYLSVVDYSGDCTWSEAESYANQYGGQLGSLDSEEDWNTITSTIRAYGCTDIIFYVGAQRNANGEVVWLSGEKVTDHWLPGEPSVTGPTDDGRTVDEPFVALFYRESDDTFYLMDVPDDMLDAASCYKDHIGYIFEYDY